MNNYDNFEHTSDKPAKELLLGVLVGMTIAILVFVLGWFTWYIANLKGI